MNFSQRMGLINISDIIQTESMNEALRISIWNTLDTMLFRRSSFKTSFYGEPSGLHFFSRKLWNHHFKKRVDSIPENPDEIIRMIDKYFFTCKWNEVYDFVEFIIKNEKEPRLSASLNIVLERELSGYRIIDNLIVPVSDNFEIEEIQKSIETGPFEGAQKHIRQAIQHLANKEAPDYRNSIKESISAVESIAKELTGQKKATLGQVLNTLEKEYGLHSSLKSGFAALYGYTSDAGGIRHAMLSEPSLDMNDAKYFLVTCSSFINFLKAKYAKIS
ncbi:AbiJ-NTD4 domain-containing protein [Gallaecimonas mangrovi]|uniref:AbiJ-NTD4 domain-containing protein n=1 Tax=Gallaecimonas mangrovi TaxID=2291597 RepID=UPI000E2057C3|nr:hypothetical protein [Gallaecimonas mangrovi]